jgi:hypothetical protein
MKTKLVAAAIGAIVLTGSTLALAGDWSARNVEKWGDSSRHERSWSEPDRRDWDRDQQHFGGYGHAKPYWHHHYQHHHHHKWKPKRHYYAAHHYGYSPPYRYDRDEVIIIFRGSFY